MQAAGQQAGRVLAVQQHQAARGAAEQALGAQRAQRSRIQAAAPAGRPGTVRDSGLGGAAGGGGGRLRLAGRADDHRAGGGGGGTRSAPGRSAYSAPRVVSVTSATGYVR